MFLIRVGLGSARRFFRGSVQLRSKSTNAKIWDLRNAKLHEIYDEPFRGLTKGTKEYDALSFSGKVWEDHFRPQETKPYDELQHAYRDTLAEIDEWKELMELRIPELGRTLVSEYAHQSVEIEHNPIKAGESQIIFDMVDKEVLTPKPFTNYSTQELTTIPLPQYHSSTNHSAVVELMNHIIASHWIATNAVTYPGTTGLGESDMKELAKLTIQGTDAEALYTYSWGGRTALGEYRKRPMQAASNLLRIFPYHDEVPACMRRFFMWRDSRHYGSRVHPLIHACHTIVYFLHIHPFPDGNGRVARMLMHDYLLRQGFLPVVMQDLERKDYLRMISDSQDGEPAEFVLRVLQTQLEQLKTFYARQKME